MSKKKPVMSHDPLAGIDEAVKPVSMPGGPEQADEVASHAAIPGESRVAAAAGVAPGGVDDGGGKFATVMLESSLTIAEAAALQEVMLTHFRAMTPLCLDASEVETVDTAGLQLIATAYKTASAKGVEFRIQEPSKKFVDSARQIGLGELLGVDGVAVGA